LALRIRRSITIGAGVRRGGGAGAVRYSLGAPAGRRPGRRTVASAHPPPNWAITAKPGLLAPPHERDFFMGLEELRRGQAELALERFEAAARRDTRGRALSDDLLAGLTALQVGDAARGTPHLEAVVASDAGLPDDLLRKYAPELAFDLSITPEVTAVIPAGSLAAALALVECYQAVGRTDEAIGLLQQLIELDAEPALMLSLCELYVETRDWDEVVELAAAVENADDVSLQMLLYRATAHAGRDEDDAALADFDAALTSKRRSDELLRAARYGRGALRLRLGDAAGAREDLEAVAAGDPEYRDCARLLEELGSS
jgi:tetratricopeptide (TPR) repeat protein